MRGKNKINLKRTLNGVGIFSSVFLFTAAAIWLYSPTFGTNAAEQSSFKVGANIKSNISIVADSQVRFGLPDSSYNEVVKKRLDVKVLTTVESGYDLYFSTAVDNTSLETIGGSNKQIKSISSSTRNISSMQWGYAVDPTGSSYYYQPIPKASSPSRIKTVAKIPTGEDSVTKLEFAVNLPGKSSSDGLIEGEYRKNIVLTAVAIESPDPTEDDYDDDPDTRTIFDITYMHEISKKICKNTTTPTVTATEYTAVHTTNANLVPQTILTDIRDGKTYLVRKYADGNCWMGQNLEFDFKTASDGFSQDISTLTTTTLDPQYTDISDMSLFNRSDNAFQTNTFYATQVKLGVTNSVYYAWPVNTSRSFSVAAAGFPAYVVKSGHTAGDGWYLFEESRTGERYQRIGNYYSVNAAYAGYTAVASDYITVQNSICPKGWQIPASVGDKSYMTLIGIYYGVRYGLNYGYDEIFNWKETFQNDENAYQVSSTQLFNSVVDQPLTMYPTGVYSDAYISYKTIAGVYTTTGENSGWSGQQILDNSNTYFTIDNSTYGELPRVSFLDSRSYVSGRYTKNGVIRCVAR